MSMIRILVTMALGLLPTAAFADAFSVFQVQGSFQNGSLLSGTLTLDTTTGSFTDGNVNGDYPPTPYGQGFDASGRYFVEVTSYNPLFPSNQTYSFQYLYLPTLPSAGQTLPLCSLSNPCAELPSGTAVSYYETVAGNFGQYRQIYQLSSGQISPLAGATPTPEPSSFLLLGSGLIVVGAAFRRRLFC